MGNEDYVPVVGSFRRKVLKKQCCTGRHIETVRGAYSTYIFLWLIKQNWPLTADESLEQGETRRDGSNSFIVIKWVFVS